jgi:DNA-damage-inducible protein D
LGFGQTDCRKTGNRDELIMENKLTNIDEKTVFEQIKQLDENGNEFWGARSLSKILDYSEFRNFVPVIERAKEACKNSNEDVDYHFVDYHEEITHGKGAKQDYPSVKLSRYSCYLIVQNADPGKEVVALGQTYFAIQTRLQEIQQMEAYNKLSNEDEKRVFLRCECRNTTNNLPKLRKVRA